MDVQTIVMEPDAAAAKLAEYRERRRRGVDVEAERAERAYRELAKGTPLLMLADVMSQAPIDEKGRPRLAIARADMPQVQFTRYGSSSPARYEFDARRSGRGNRKELVILVDLLEPSTWSRTAGYQTGYSLVPMVPPDVLGNRSPSTHYVLWEVEKWADSPLSPIPDRDPYLLRRLDADLWAVVGEWDLTDVERAIMRGRISR
jgi:hypothetical protein